MSIAYLPKELQSSDALACALCGAQLPFSLATVGLVYASNQQAFSCSSHLFRAEELIVGWADFLWSEKIKYVKPDLEPNELIYERMHYAWPHS